MKTKATKPEAFENKFPHFSHNRKYPWNRLESKMNPWCSQRGLAWSHSDKRVIVIVDKMGKKVSLITLHQFCSFHLNDISICTEGEKLTFSISRKLLPSCIFFYFRGVSARDFHLLNGTIFNKTRLSRSFYWRVSDWRVISASLIWQG